MLPTRRKCSAPEQRLLCTRITDLELPAVLKGQLSRLRVRPVNNAWRPQPRQKPVAIRSVRHLAWLTDDRTLMSKLSEESREKISAAMSDIYQQLRSIRDAAAAARKAARIAQREAEAATAQSTPPKPAAVEGLEMFEKSNWPKDDTPVDAESLFNLPR